MNSFPVVSRELRAASRQPRTYWLRLAIAMVVLLWMWFMITPARMGGIASASARAFLVISSLALIYTMLAGVFLTADCLSQERREGTLGLLFLTDLRSLDILLGKLAAAALNASYSILAVFPVLSLCLFLGGVTGAEIFRISLVLMGSLCASLAIGMLISALGKEMRHTVTATLLALLGIFLFMPLLAYVLSGANLRHSLFRAAACFSPLVNFVFALEGPYAQFSNPYFFVASVACPLALSLVCLVICLGILRRAVNQDSHSVSTGFVARKLCYWRFGPPILRQNWRQYWLNINPFLWLIARDRTSQRLMHGIGWIGSLGSLFLVYCSLRNPLFRAYYFTLALLPLAGMHLAVKFLVALETSRHFCENRHNGTLELVLTTPLNERAISQGFSQAVFALFKPSLLQLVVLDLFFAFLALAGAGYWAFPSDVVMVYAVSLFSFAALLWADFWALTWVGMTMSLRIAKSYMATVATFAWVMLPSWLLFALIFSLNQSFRTGETVLLLAIWLIISFVNSVALALISKEQLLRRFRESVRTS